MTPALHPIWRTLRYWKLLANLAVQQAHQAQGYRAKLRLWSLLMRMGVGVLNKCCLLFPHTFWNERIDWLNLLPKQGRAGQWGEWVSFARPTGRPVLMGFNAADFGRKLEALDDKAIVQGAMGALRTMFGPNIPSPVDGRRLPPDFALALVGAGHGAGTDRSTDMISVLICDDHALVRYGIAAVLEAHGEFRLVGAVGDGERAIDLAAREHPDVVLMDLLMPGTSGVTATREIRRVSPVS